MKHRQYGDDIIGTQWGDAPLWYKDAVIYQLHVKAFYNSNSNDIDDFRDIADYRNIYPAFGTRKDFHAFVREAHQRGLKIITELVVNLTSDQHPWFRAAREAPRDSA